MQIAHAFVAVGHFIAAHWPAFLLAAVVVAVLLALEIRWVRRRRPTDTTGNGITVGSAKAFDNRSLALRLERLNAGLEAFKVINQNLVENVTAFQQQTATETTASLSLNTKAVSRDGERGNPRRKLRRRQPRPPLRLLPMASSPTSSRPSGWVPATSLAIS